MKMNRFLFSKRGIGIEIAIFMLAAVFGLCTIILAFSVRTKNHSFDTLSSFNSAVIVDQIGEWFVSGTETDLPDGYIFDENTMVITCGEKSFDVRITAEEAVDEKTNNKTVIQNFSLNDRENGENVLIVSLRFCYDFLSITETDIVSGEYVFVSKEILRWECRI